MNKSVVNKKEISAEEWIEDIKFLKNKIINKHPNPYIRLSEKEFNNKIEDLIEKVPKLESKEIEFRVRELVAEIGDMHTTTVFINEDSKFPFTLKKFNNDFRIIAAGEKYSNILGFKLETINNIQVQEILEEIKRIIPNENCIYRESKALEYLSYPEILQIIGIKDVYKGISLCLIDFNGEEVESYMEFSMEIDNMKELTENSNNLPKRKMINKNFELPYWFQYIEERNILYIKYNMCMDNRFAETWNMPYFREYPDFYDFIEELYNVIEVENVQKVIFDMRNNIGGNPKYSKYIFLKLCESSKWTSCLNKKDNFFILINSGVVSGGVETCEYLKLNTKATFVGEPTGGNVSSFAVGIKDDFRLPNSQIYVVCASKRGNNSLLDFEFNFIPDVKIDTTFEDYLNRNDPVFNYVCDYHIKSLV